MRDFEGEHSGMDHGPESTVLIDPRPMRGFVKTPQIKEVATRALNYLRAGFPVHFRGPTGAGKTTLALHVAHRLRQPMVLIHGDDQFTSADLTGKSNGYSRKKVIDEFVRGVSKTEESMQSNWSDHRLTVAIREGHTLLYDEFNRSRPEANNILLSVLQEGVLDFPVSGGKGETYLQVHPKFRVIFTSNPEEYAGVNKTQDALLDRMVTIDLEHYDVETEVRITKAKSRLSEEDSRRIVTIVRELRKMGKSGYLPTVRGCIMVGKSVKKFRGANVLRDCEPFRRICHDVLISEITRKEIGEFQGDIRQKLNELIDEHCLSSTELLQKKSEAEVMMSADSVKDSDISIAQPSDFMGDEDGIEASENQISSAELNEGLTQDHLNNHVESTLPNAEAVDNSADVVSIENEGAMHPIAQSEDEPEGIRIKEPSPLYSLPYEAKEIPQI